jgi:hypothetical protein
MVGRVSTAADLRGPRDGFHHVRHPRGTVPAERGYGVTCEAHTETIHFPAEKRRVFVERDMWLEASP